MSRWPAIALGVLGLAGAALLAPEPSASRSGPLAAVAGPLRPLLGDVLWIRFEQSRLRHDHFTLVQDAGRILRLRPDVPELWGRLAYVFVLDVPGELAGEVLGPAWVAEGFRILEEGRRRFPRSSVLARVRGDCLVALASQHPERLPDAVDEPWSEALGAYREALALARSTPDRDLARLSLVLLVERLAGEPGPVSLQEQARSVGRELLQSPDLPAESRRQIEEALGRDR